MAKIDIFLGNPIEHESERATLSRVVDILLGRDVSAVVLANVNLSGRQIDLVICLNQGVLVIEAKGFSSAVQGSENGRWQMRLASGRWKETPNFYSQALGEKMALRDAMALFHGTDVPYPDAVLMFVPVIPVGSEITKGDFKVAIAGLDQMSERIDAVNSPGWSLERWRAFAAYHHLIAVPSIQAALSHELLDADRLLAAYGRAFLRTYSPLVTTMVPMSCILDGKIIAAADIVEDAARGENLRFIGASGCGKSLLTYSIAISALNHLRVPIVIPAKDFEGSLRDVANREVTLLNMPSAAALISATYRLGRRLLFIVDGYNECTPSERQRFTRSIAAIATRYNAVVIVSSNLELERGDLLPARTYVVQVPSAGMKRVIAQRAAGGESVEAFSDLLDSVGSCLEASMIGQLRQRLPLGTSKFGLFDAYVRERLGATASDGIRALSRVAAMMTDRISFTLTVRELDRLSDREGMSGALLHTFHSANILNWRGDRVSFSHEMFLNIFAAEAIIRRAENDPNAVVEALRLPQHLEMKPFVLGAIDDDRFRRQVLLNFSDAKVMRACLDGQCGNDARLWANERCEEVLGYVQKEIETVQFDFSEQLDWRVGPKTETLWNWTEQDRAVLATIPLEVLTGRRLDSVLALIGRMDARLDEEYSRLLEEARKNKINLRSGLYAVSYGGFGTPKTGLNQIFGPVQHGHLHGGPKMSTTINLCERLCDDTLSPGQVGFLIELDKYSDHDGPSLGTVLPSVLNRLWPRAAHHLRIGLMHAAGMSARALTEDDRRALIDAIEPLLATNGGFDSTGIIDALKYLGALDDDEAEHVESVRSEMEDALADSGNPTMWDKAAGLWNSQFDHPYDGAYCEAWSDLADEKRKSLLIMAAQSVDYDSMFTPSLIAEVAAYDGSTVGSIIERWTVLPPKEQVMIGDSIHTFAIAYAALARLHYPLPDRLSESTLPADQAFLACGAILYWLNRDDLLHAERKRNCAGPLGILSQHQLGVAATVMGEFFRSDFMFSEVTKRLPGSEPIVTSFGDDFPDEVAAIFRAALEHPSLQTGYFKFFRIEDLIEKALTALGHFGNAQDIPLLRAWSTYPNLGQIVIRAIKMIEEIQR